MANDVEYFLKCLSAILDSLAESSLFKSALLFYWIIFPLMMNFLSSLYILEIRLLSDVKLLKVFVHSVGCCFVFLAMSFALQKLLSFRRSHLLIVSHNVCASGFIFRKWPPVPICSFSLSLL